MSDAEYNDVEKCHYCGQEFDSREMSSHLREKTEILAELPAVLGSGGMSPGSIDLHDGKLYMCVVKPGPCMDDVKASRISKEQAKMMILTEINFHKQMFERLSESTARVFEKLESS